MWVSHIYPFLQVSFPPRHPQFLFYSSNPPPFPLFHAPSFPLNPSIKATSQPLHTSSNNHLIQSLCWQGNLKQAIQVLTQEPSPSQRTYEALILTCTQQNALSYGSIVHRHLAVDGFDQDSFLCTKLVDMYSQFNAIDDAREVFEKTRDKTIFLWNALLKALALADRGEEAISRCREMGRIGITFDSFSYSYVLKACVCPSSDPLLVSRRVCEIHCHVLRNGFQSRVHVATTLLDAYARLGRVSYARHVFDGMLERNVVSWSAMISCYANNERAFEALGLFCAMMAEAQDILPNSVTMVNVLQACANLSALGLGKLVHAYVLRRGLDSIVSVNNALISMYIKCGSMETGLRIFDVMRNQRDVVSWNSIISGYGIHGFGKEAIQVFKEMIRVGISPTFITFISVLGACSHAGLVQEAKTLFDSMVHEHGIIPRAEHYACIVDLLGRAGQLDEAAKVVEGMRIEPGPTVWGSLLGACRTRGYVELAERACNRLFELEPENAGNYVLLADTYAEAKMWEEVSRVRKLMEHQNLQKVPGCCWIEVKRNVYSFASADEMNPRMEQIHAFLIHLVAEMKEIGYVPETKVVLYNLDEKEKEHILLGHSEKLAVAFGLINNSRGETIRVTKNLRLCEDCHTFTKLLSKFARIEIFVRDVNRCHDFRDGTCSCQDYW